MSKAINLLIVVLLLAGSLGAQQDSYSRKSITFLDAIILASPDARNMRLSQIDHTAEVVKNYVQLDRFDYNPIPSSSSLMTSFLTRVNDEDDLDLDAISEMLNRTFVPAIVDIMDEHAEQRASELVDETTRMSFITTKAKDLGITAENLEQVFNSGYIYLPFINGFSESLEAEEVDEETKYDATVSLSGGIFWFKIFYDNGQTSVRPLLKKETQSTGFARKNSANQAEQAAFEAAALNYARNLENATKEIEGFKLKAQLMEVTGSNVGFSMGRKEGLRIDDRFIVGEMVMNAAGDLEFAENGFARVSEIGDNRTDPSAMSYGYGVIVGDWAPGMSLVEYPTLNIDIYGMLGSLPLRTSEPGYELNSAVAFGVEMAYNLGQFVNKSHRYLTAGATIGTAQLLDTYWDESDFGATAVADLAFMRRFQKKRLDAFYKFGMAFHVTSITVDDEDEYMNEAIGAVFGCGFNVTTSIDLAFGMRYSLLTAVSDTWTVTYSDDTEGEETFNADYSGGAIMFQIIWAPKSLGFDPISALQNVTDL